jgi:hypothetical protein
VSTVSTLDPKLVSALEDTVDVLRSVAEYRLPPEVVDRMRELGENKEACTPEEREEHRNLADVWLKRSLQKAQALRALKQLHDVLPELVDAPTELTDNV